MECLFIYNPVSGRGKINKKTQFIIDNLETKFGMVDVLETKYAGHIFEFLQLKPNVYSTIVVAGGDGTLNEVINAISEFDIKPVLGYIPCGTTNDFAKSLGISKNIRKSLKTIFNGKITSYDILKINNRYASYECCSGIFSSSSFKTKQKYKNLFGRIAYFINGFKEFFRYKPFYVEIKSDNFSFRGFVCLFLIVNSNYVAGFNINKGASLNDGKVDLFIFKNNSVKKVGFLNKLSVMKFFLFGKKCKDKNILKLTTSSVEVEYLCPVALNIDGENVLNNNFSLKVKHNWIRFFV